MNVSWTVSFSFLYFKSDLGHRLIIIFSSKCFFFIVEENVIEGREGINFGSYPYLAPILVTVISVLVLMLVVAKLVSLMMHRRYERYREALLASKNSIIYQKLSEDIVAPTTPKVHRYAPINQV